MSVSLFFFSVITPAVKISYQYRAKSKINSNFGGGTNAPKQQQDNKQHNLVHTLKSCLQETQELE